MAFDWLATLKTIAPGLATAFGGPLAGLAVTAIGNALNVPEPTQEKIQAAIAGATPDDLLKVKQAEEQFQVQMKQLDINLEQISESDRDSARKREAAVGDKTTRNLAYLLIIGGLTFIAATFAGITKVDSALAGTLIGYLISEMKQVLSYYFGSSEGSKNKDETIATIAKS